MEKKMHLLSNAHLDPEWQWEWEEGAAEALSTFRCAARFCREFDGYIFCHNEALLYRWVEEYEPSLFEEIRELVRLGRWHIMGGWFLQPDCNMPSGEGFVRNINEGRAYFEEKFGKRPTTAINFDPFGHTRGLVQILRKSGFDSYMFCRPAERFIHLPSDTFRWIGYDGSEVLACRAREGYNSGLGRAVDKMKKAEAKLTESAPVCFCLWGVGDHGGGASEQDLRAIETYIKECADRGIEVLHSTPEAFFADLRASGVSLPDVDVSLNPWAPGCYTSQVRVKQKYREAENAYLFCEKMCAALSSQTDFTYPADELHEALLDILTVQFHDALPGSSVQAVEEMVFRMLDHALEILSRIRMRAFIRLCRGQKKAKEGEIPILCFNPHPYPVTDDFHCEFMLADQNWSGSFTMPEVYDGETKIPSQCEKEASNIPLDWRKRQVFRATLPPMAIKRFDVRLTSLAKKPVPACPETKESLVFTSKALSVKISKKTGLIESVMSEGTEYVRPGAFTLDAVKDDSDPWGMRVCGWHEKAGEFTLCTEEEASRVMDLDGLLPAVHTVEDGEVRTVVEAVFGYGHSRAIVRYTMSKLAPELRLHIRLINNEKSTLIRLAVPYAAKEEVPVLETAFGEEAMKTNGDECVGQSYMRIGTGKKSIAVLNRGTYGSSCFEGTAYLTLLRGPGYTVHPINEKNPLPQDRYTPHIDQGERLFEFAFLFGETPDPARRAQAFNQMPMTLSFFPDGSEAPEMQCPLSLTGDPVVLTAFKKADAGEEAVVRLFNPGALPAEVKMESSVFSLSAALSFDPYEVKCMRLTKGKTTECDLTEKPL